MSITLRTLTCAFALSPFAVAQAVPPMPEYPPQGHVLVGDMWVPRHVVFEDGHWDGPSWTNGVVPYWFASSVSLGEQEAMLLAMAELEAVCGLDFVPWSAGPHRLVIRENPASSTYSNSMVGMQPLGQILNVGSEHWDNPFVLVHELMHAVGIKHEHQRPDRNLYITINWNNVHQSACDDNPCNGNFQIFNGQTLTPYDFASVMHYPAGSQSIGSSDTITCKPGFAQYQNVIGQSSYLSYYDVQSLQIKYGIPAGPSISTFLPTQTVEGVGTVDLIFTGSGFFSGSLQANAGTQGSRMQYMLGGVWHDMPFWVVESGTKIKAQLHIDSVFPTGVIPIRVLNDSLAGGASNVVLFTVTAIPCGSANEQLGHAVVGLPDTDGDGCDEMLVSRPGYQTGRGQVLCFSGKDGSELWARQGAPLNGNFGYALADIGDLNGDLVHDVAVGMPNAGNGRVIVLSGVDGATLRTIDASIFGSGPGFGTAVAAAGDLDLDGTPDLVIGSPDHASGRGRIDLVSGGSGGLFFAFPGLQNGERFGSAISGGVDLNGDGRPEVVAGAPLFDGGNGLDCGRIAIYEAAFGTALVGTEGDGAGDRLGTAVAIAPSTNGTALGCVVAGAPENGAGPGTAGPGYVRQYRYLSGPLTGLLEVATWREYYAGARFGNRLLAVGDLDDDGGTDFLIAAPGDTTNDATVQLLSGRSGDVLWRTRRSPSSDGFGSSLGVVDRSGAGNYSALIGTPGHDGFCVDSGNWVASSMRVRPAFERLMITEINTAVSGSLPAAVELTNFASVPVDLSGWQVRFRNLWPIGSSGSGESSSLAGVVLQPRQSVVLRTTFGAAFAETPPSVQTLAVLSNGPALATDFLCGLIAPNGYVVDEVRSANGSGFYFEGSFGGKFDQPIQNHQEGPLYSVRRLERIWGLDTNRSTDWTIGGPRSMGLESGSGGRRSWPRVESFRPPVVINEIARGSGHYVELRNRGTMPLNLQGWALRFSTPQGSAIAEVLPFPEHESLAPGGLLVVGSTAQPPAEKPASVGYVRVNNFQLGTVEFSIGLYDHRGQVVDLVRATRPGSTLVHNDPRLPSHPNDFRIAAFTGGAGFSLVRNQDSDDHDVGDDWRPFAIRSLGSSNPPTWTADQEQGLDVRVNRRPGVSMAVILDGEAERQGSFWSFALSIGHYYGQGPILGLGPDALTNWVNLSAIPPFSGVLDANGDARFDLDESLLPPGLPLDLLFVLIDPTNGAVVTLTPVVSYDS